MVSEKYFAGLFGLVEKCNAEYLGCGIRRTFREEYVAMSIERNIWLRLHSHSREDGKEYSKQYRGRAEGSMPIATSSVWSGHFLSLFHREREGFI